jgi:GNAT superfamily N-acetyltransferase
MLIRPGRPADATAIADIRVRSWRRAYTGLLPDDFLTALDPAAEAGGWRLLLEMACPPASGFLIAEAGGTPIGFTGYGPADRQPSTGEIHTFYVVPEAWGVGIGTRLMTALLETLEYEQAVLWVLEGNTRARGFYESTGWHADGATDTEAIGDHKLTKVRYRRS